MLGLAVAAALALATPPARTPPQVRFEAALPHIRFGNPVHVAGMRDGGRHWLVAEVGGRLHQVAARDDVRRTRVVLDLGRRVVQRNFVEGLLGFALHPQWPANRALFVFYATARAGGPAQAVLSRFTWPNGSAVVDARSEAVLLSIDNPNTYHHGGSIAFGPDGFLYLGVGDMGPQGDTGNVAQDLGSLRGKILRIDVEAPTYRVPADNPFVKTPGARPEVWASGFRNPYRISFDPVSGDLWVGDVGQVTEEEVDLVRRGGNYGWNVREGKTAFRTPAVAVPKFDEPVLSYGRTVGASITGGHVYRGRRLRDLVGAYVYADWVSSRAFYLRHDGTRVTEAGELGRLPNANSLGVDDDGEIVAVGMDGRLMRLVAGDPIAAPAKWAMSGSPIEDAPVLEEPALLTLARTGAAAKRGRRLFGEAGCPACHGPQGQGGIGPNLRDGHWLGGARLPDIVGAIARGNPQRGMPSWGEVLPAPALADLGVFVAGLRRGPFVPGKAPEGKRTDP